MLVFRERKMNGLKINWKRTGIAALVAVATATGAAGYYLRSSSNGDAVFAERTKALGLNDTLVASPENMRMYLEIKGFVKPRNRIVHGKVQWFDSISGRTLYESNINEKRLDYGIDTLKYDRIIE